MQLLPVSCHSMVYCFTTSCFIFPIFAIRSVWFCCIPVQIVLVWDIFCRPSSSLTLVISVFSEPGKWSTLFPECGGQRQSPINIVTSRVLYDAALTSFTFEGHNHVSNITVDHLGHSGDSTLFYYFNLPFKCVCAELSMTALTDEKPSVISAHFALPPSAKIHGGGLASTYKALQFHLHWGVDAGPGSEHTVDGERYPMEVGMHSSQCTEQLGQHCRWVVW